MDQRSTPVVTRTEGERVSRVRIPHRHSAPYAPWPWLDNDDKPLSAGPPEKPTVCPHEEGRCVGCWTGYPQSLFPNWTPEQVERSKMIALISSRQESCMIHVVDVAEDGSFSDPAYYLSEGRGGGRILEHGPVGEDEKFWQIMQDSKRGDNVRVRALFVENLSVPVLKMLGTRYKVEPFFWSSSANWIPSRYQESSEALESDHITITLSFPRPVEWDTRYNRESLAIHEVIDTNSPLPLRSDFDRHHVLILDLLAIHMIRGPDSSTIISYQPSPDRHVTSAANLHARVYLAGQSVYWQNIFRRSSDPTFVLLTMLWYALYAWDQALELLWEHICKLEVDVINTSNIRFTQELHRIRAHLLHYASLLEDFSQTVHFVLETPNPAMASARYDSERTFSRLRLEKECHNLLTQIHRLSDSRRMWDKRLKNVMNLAFSTVNIEDSKHMQRLTEAAVRDSAAMKQISYLTMVFLPASFVATAFGMNIKEINPSSHGTLAHYAETAIPLTLVTMWFVVALQGKWFQGNEEQEMSLLTRFSWPIIWLQRRVAMRGQIQRHMALDNHNGRDNV